MSGTRANAGIGLMIENLNDKVDAIYRHNMLLDSYSARVRDYGNGCVMTELEAHTLSFICKNGSVTVTRLAAYTARTKGTVSKLLKKLEEKGYVRRDMRDGNRKWVYFSPTERGLAADETHRSYDRVMTMEMIEALLRDCTIEEIESFYKVTSARIRYLEKTMQARPADPSGEDETF